MTELLLPGLAVAGIAGLAWLRPRLAFYVVLGTLPTQFLFVPVATFYLSPVDVVVLGSGAALGGRWLRGDRETRRAIRMHMWVGALLAAYAVGGLAEGRVPPRTLARVGLAAIPSVLALELLRGRRHLVAATTALVTAGVVDAALAGWLYANGTSLHPTRFSGVGGPNFSGMVLALASGVALVRLARTRQPLALALPGALAALTFASLSKSGILTLALAGAAAVPLLTRRNRLLIGAALSIVVVAALAEPGLRTALWERTQPAEQNDGVARSSMELRWWMLVTAGRAFADHPLTGIGFGRFQGYSVTNPEIRGATAGVGFGTHNTYMEVLAEGGLLALLPLVLHFRHLRRVPATWRRAVRAGDLASAASLAALLIVLVSAAFMNLLLHYGFWAVTGLALAATERAAESPVQAGAEVRS